MLGITDSTNAAAKNMSTCEMIMSTNANIIMLHVNIIMFHVNIIMLHLEKKYLACWEQQKYASMIFDTSSLFMVLWIN